VKWSTDVDNNCASSACHKYQTYKQDSSLDRSTYTAHMKSPLLMIL